ncbi:MAG TPA: response regulator [Lamprocystis sp. (in: g-proteobacteria)]|nr:response regulator [Lamprocystis sp. (in: g-proteobacteria)]
MSEIATDIREGTAANERRPPPMDEPPAGSVFVLPDEWSAEPMPRVLVVRHHPVDPASGPDASGGLVNWEPRPEYAGHLADGLAMLAPGRFDCVLLDVDPVNPHGYEAMARLRAQAPDLPVVVCAGHADETLGPSLIAAGAEDVVCRDGADGRQLGRVVRHAVARLRRRAAASAVQGARERRGVGRLMAPSGHSGEAARIYGAGTLREADSRTFDLIVDDYVELVKHTAESQVFRTGPGEGRSARPLAERMGFLGAGPRDAIEVHTEALLRLDQGFSAADQRQIALEGRIVVLELMGYLAGYYRRYYLSSMSLARDPADAHERPLD